MLLKAFDLLKDYIIEVINLSRKWQNLTETYRVLKQVARGFLSNFN